MKQTKPADKPGLGLLQYTGRGVTSQSQNWTTLDFRTMVVEEEQEELLLVQRSSVGDMACSVLKDTVLYEPNSAKGLRQNHFDCLCWSVHQVAEEGKVLQDDRFCIKCLGHSTWQRTLDWQHSHQANFSLKTDTGADLLIVSKHIYLY